MCMINCVDIINWLYTQNMLHENNELQASSASQNGLEGWDEENSTYEEQRLFKNWEKLFKKAHENFYIHVKSFYMR